MEAPDTDVNGQSDGFALGRVYSRDELKRLTGLSLQTFDDMEVDGGLERLAPTKKVFYYADDVLEAMREITRKKKKG